MKIKGAELKQFMEDGWPSDEWYWDHEVFEEDPEPEITYETADIGPLYFQGSAPHDGSALDLAHLIRKWRKERDFEVLTINVKKSDVGKVRSYLAELGIKS